MEKPLIVMEGTLLGMDYMSLGGDLGRVRNVIIEMAKLCKKYNGTFTLLWHNSSLATKALKGIYVDIIESIVSKDL